MRAEPCRKIHMQQGHAICAWHPPQMARQPLACLGPVQFLDMPPKEKRERPTHDLWPLPSCAGWEEFSGDAKKAGDFFGKARRQPGPVPLLPFGTGREPELEPGLPA